MKKKSVDVPADVDVAIREFAEDRNIDQSVAMRRTMQRGLEHYGYLNGRVLPTRAAQHVGYGLLLAAAIMTLVGVGSTVSLLPIAAPLAGVGASALLAVHLGPRVARRWDDVIGRGEPS